MSHPDGELPVIALDYCYLNEQESDDRASPILVVKDTYHKWPDSEIVPSKGPQHPYSVAAFVDILVNHGHSKYILKSDNEPAILELKRVAAAECRMNHGHTIIFEESPVGEHQANGFIEEGVRSIKAKCRTLKFACEELHGTKISSEHPILPWLVRHAAACLAYGQRGPDGRTPYERKKQKSFRLSLPCFGEKVMYLRGPKQSGLDDRWKNGIFVGLIRRSQELLVATPEGVYKCRSVKRMTSEERIDRNAFDSIRGAPWQPIPGQALMDVPVQIRVDIPAVIPHTALPPPVEVAPPNRRRTYIRRDIELRKYGYSQSCPGCDAARTNTNPVAHSEACRLRIERAMEVDEADRVRITEGFLRASANAGPSAKRSRVSPTTPSAPSAAIDSPSAAASGNIIAVPRGDAEMNQAPPAAAQAMDTDPITGVKRPAEETGPVNPADRMLHSVTFDPTETVMREIEKSLTALGLDDVHIAEIFCPGRFTAQASLFGLIPGTAMDLRTGWDFNLPENRRRAEQCVKSERPALLVGSPKCAAFSILQNLNPDSPQWRATLREGIEHLTFVCHLYKIQIEENRFFLHEHPDSAASWGLWMVREISEMPSVIRTSGDQCPFGLLGSDEFGPALIQKRTGWMTNSPRIAAAVTKRCTNRINPKHMHHRHGRVFAWKNCRESEAYPPRLVSAILKALRAELIDCRLLGALDVGMTADEPEPLQLHPEWYQHVIDQSTGKPLPPELVAKAREEEMGFVRKMKIWEYDTVENCLAKSGRQPIPMGWVDINKGDDEHPKVRCRLVVQETRRQTTIDPENTAAVFSATPPYEAMRMIISMLMTPRTPEEHDHVLTFIDISRAHPHAPMRRDLWVKLPPEDPRSGEPGICGRLLKCMYGAKDAGQNFELYTHDFMVSREFRVGLFTPCVFHSEKKNQQVYVYGDNFVVKGSRSENQQFVADLKTEMLANVEGVLGPDPTQGDEQEVVCLNKIFRYVRGQTGNPDGATIEIEADPRHADIIIQSLGLASASKAVVTPGLKQKVDAAADTPLPANEAQAYRSLTMRAAYIAEDRPDLKFATKELARSMQCPTSGSWEALKRLGRYLLGTPRLIQRMERQPPQTTCVAYSDSDHAGCLRTRKSTSGTILMHGKHMVKMLSTTQTPIALSSAESEWYAGVRSASALLGFQALASDLGRELTARLALDATAAKGIAARRGVGKIRHLETQTLWLQRHVTNKRLSVEKVLGELNPADLGTKHVERATLTRLLEIIAFSPRAGRSKIALQTTRLEP